VEIFAGPNLSFNYGNMFIENYKDDFVTNKRLLKPGYTLGIGVYHRLSNRSDLNIRFHFEQKGTRNELTTPSLPHGNKQIDYFNYSYNYITFSSAKNHEIGIRKRFVVSIGAYYSKILKIKGIGKTYDVMGTITKNEGSYEGRFFYDLTNVGTRQGFTWSPDLTSIEDHDLGLVCSLGYRLLIKKQIILIQLQDNYGLKNINKNNPYGLKEKNHLLTLNVSYLYNLPLKH